MIETENIILRSASFAHCDSFAKWESEQSIIEHFSNIGKRDLSQITTDFHNVINDRTRKWLTIILKETGEPIGKVVLSDIDHINDSAAISTIYIAAMDLRGKGLGKEAFAATFYYAFKYMNLERLELRHFPEDSNEALYEKLGFKKEGRLKNAGKRNGKYEDMELRAILREDWESRL